MWLISWSHSAPDVVRARIPRSDRLRAPSAPRRRGRHAWSPITGSATEGLMEPGAGMDLHLSAHGRRLPDQEGARSADAHGEYDDVVGLVPAGLPQHRAKLSHAGARRRGGQRSEKAGQRSRTSRFSQIGSHVSRCPPSRDGRAEVVGCRPRHRRQSGQGRSCSAMTRRASSSWSSSLMIRQAASNAVPWSTSSRTRAAIRSWWRE